MKKKFHFKCLYIAADKFPPFRSDVAVLFGEVLPARGHEVEWVLQSEIHIDQAEKVEWRNSVVWVGAASAGQSKLARFKKNIQGFLNDLKMFRLARQKNFDFIQVKDKFIAGILGVIVAKISNVKFIYWLSYPFPEAQIYRAKTGTALFPVLYYVRGIFFKFILYQVIMRFSDHVFVQSEQMKQDVIKEGIAEEKLTPVPMGVTFDIFEKANALYSVSSLPDEKIVLYLGTLLKVRRIDFVVRMFVMVLEAVPDAKLYLVGDSSEPDDILALKQLVKDFGIDKSVVFTGNLKQEEALEYVQRASVCLSPFYPTPILNSTSPTKLVEYMAMRKPVVANDHPEQRLVLAESGAGICVPYEESEFSRAVIRLLNAPLAAANMGENGYEYVKKHRDYQVIADLVEKKYADILGQQTDI